MKKIVILFLLLISQLSLAFASNVEVEGKVKVNLIEGKVLLEDKVLKEGDLILPPARIQVLSKSKLELVLPDNSVLRFNENTEFNLVKAEYNGQKRDMQTEMVLGECWASVKKLLGEDNKFEVATPTAVAGVAGTKYRVVANKEYSKFLVYDGKIQVGYRPVSENYQPGKSLLATRVEGPKKVAGPKRISMQEWVILVSKGYEFVIYPDGRFVPPKKFDQEAESKDPWVLWNLERDRILGF